MRIDRGLLNWGVFLIALGGVPLAVQQGWVDSSIAGDLWRLWPLILVGIGLGLILRWTPIAWLGGALVAGTFGLIFGALLAGGISGISSACVGVGEGGATTSRSGPADDGAFSLDLTLSCGDLRVERESDQTWSFEASHAEDSPPAVTAGSGRLDLAQGFDGDAFLVFSQESRNAWVVGLPASSTLAVDMTLNASSGEVDPGVGPVGALDGTFNASDIVLDLGAAANPDGTRLALTFNASSGKLALPGGDIRGDLTLNASSLQVCLPTGSEVRLDVDSILSSDGFGSAGLEEAGDVWQTPGYPGTGDTVELGISSTVSSIEIERAEVCG